MPQEATTSSTAANATTTGSSSSSSGAATVGGGGSAPVAGGGGAAATANEVSHVLATSSESIRLVAESVGINNLTEESCRELASDLTFTLRSILTDALKFARRSRRTGLVASDIDYSLKVRLIEPIYGMHSVEQTPFRCTTSTGGVGGSGRNIFYADEHVLDLNELIAVNNKSVKLPNDFVINAHWLAIEGVQPAVPENPQIVHTTTSNGLKDPTATGADAISAAASAAAKAKEKKQKQAAAAAAAQAGGAESLVKLKSIVPHEISMEQQIYFKEITEACILTDEKKRTEALNSLTTDPGLHQLLPRFIIFISEGVRLNIAQLNMAILIYLMRMAKALIENKSFYLEKYLHELLPSILSCQLGKQVCARPEQDNHFALREFCARLIGQIVKSHATTLISLHDKIVGIYLKSLHSERTSFATLFGAVVGLAELGNETCETFIFPLVRKIGERVAQVLDNPAASSEKLPAEKIRTQLTEILANCLVEKESGNAGSGGAAGAKLKIHAFIPDENELEQLTNQFGTYFAPLVHAHLMKLRAKN